MSRAVPCWAADRIASAAEGRGRLRRSCLASPLGGENPEPAERLDPAAQVWAGGAREGPNRRGVPRESVAVSRMGWQAGAAASMVRAAGAGWTAPLLGPA